MCFLKLLFFFLNCKFKLTHGLTSPTENTSDTQAVARWYGNNLKYFSFGDLTFSNFHPLNH
jgi:hypothetical protein